MEPFVDFSGKTIVVTGASSGIGQDTAVLLSQLGAKVVIVARREEELNKTLSMMDANNKHFMFCQDLSIIEEIEELVNDIVRTTGPIDGIAYCAGVNGDVPIKLMNNERFENIMRVNLSAFVEMVRCFSKKKNYNKGMRIVGVSSVAAACGGHLQMAYSASKAGMNGAMRCMASELASKGICVNTVAPAMIETKMYNDYLSIVGDESDAYKALLSRQYLGIGKTRDVANGIAFLLSSAARFISGTCLAIDGGYTST